MARNSVWYDLVWYQQHANPPEITIPFGIVRHETAFGTISFGPVSEPLPNMRSRPHVYFACSTTYIARNSVSRQTIPKWIVPRAAGPPSGTSTRAGPRQTLAQLQVPAELLKRNLRGVQRKLCQGCEASRKDALPGKTSVWLRAQKQARGSARRKEIEDRALNTSATVYVVLRFLKLALLGET